MSDNQGWDAKKDEVWKRIVELENAIKNLTGHINEVESLAKNKVSANEAEAKKAAEQAKQAVSEISEIDQKAKAFSANLPDLKEFVTQANSNFADTNRLAEEAKKALTEITGFKAAAEKAAKEISTSQEKSKKGVEEAEAKWTTTNQQIQNIANLNAQASKDAATTKASRESIEKLQQEASNLKNKFVEMQTNWEKRFGDLQKQHETKLQDLYKKRDQELSDLNQKESQELSDLHKKYLAEFETRSKEIESLLPGATSAGLASAFASRRKGKFGAKIFWWVLMILSVILLLIFGLMILFPNILSKWGITVNTIPGGTTLYGRMIILAALILLEEFSRRNFNISSRLEEAYGYKEVISRSFLGYKRQMENIPWPKNEKGDQDNNSTSILVSIFMKQLADDPSKTVFDKEHHELGLGALFDIGANTKKTFNEDAIKSLVEGRPLARINWQVVVIVGIAAFVTCFIVYMFRGLFA